MLEAAIVGGSGYTGGELARLLILHPEVELKAITSQQYTGKRISIVHPNFRKVSDLKFISPDELGNYDVIFTATPHGVSMQHMPTMVEKAKKVIDLSADFRLRDPEQYPVWYGHEHSCPELLKKAVYGIPELHRKEMKTTNLISGAGCLATSAILALYPLFKHDLIDTERVIVDSKVGSSATGNKFSLSTHHPERTRTVRSYAPSGHRHTAEMVQELSFNGTSPTISFSPHAIELVRGILSTCHVFLKEDLDEKAIWKVYREEYGEEPFIRIVKERQGIYRFPEPKILMGSNYCDIGFQRDEQSNRLIVMSAIDNMMKGAAGQAVQAMNITMGLEETSGLEAFGFHPI